MSLTLLFDLDDTLLDTNINEFVSVYFKALAKHLFGRVSPDAMVRALMQGTELMYQSEDSSRTLQDIFEKHFYPALGIPKKELTDAIEDFYDNIFPTLGTITRQRPDAAPLIDWALAQGFRVAIATDPLFPQKATWHRIRWAGIDPEKLELISTFEHFHFTKTHPAYYAEVLGRLGWPDGPVLMVGNDVDRDLLPAHMLGLKTYFVGGESASAPGFEAGSGSLADLRLWLESVNLSTLEPSFKSREATLAIMASTPAVLHSLTTSLSGSQWHHEPAPNAWALNEIVCHLRDTEREIHQVQLKLMIEKEDAFIPRPDTSVWANERDYLKDNGLTALADFTSARIESLTLLKSLEPDVWSRRARHAIFGPTNFLEVTGFLTDHDRMHIQQAWKTLKQL